MRKSILDALEIPDRVVDIATGDLGSSAVRKFDCEAWIPSQDRYRELTSTSNCARNFPIAASTGRLRNVGRRC